MVTEEEKFRADTFRILGIAFITPLGRLLVDPLAFYQEYGLVHTVIYFVYALTAAYIGLIHIEFSRGILDKRSTTKWKS